MIQFKHPIVFDNYNSDNRCMGIGLKTISALNGKEEILRIKTQMGLMSNTKLDEENREESEESKNIFQQIQDHTRKISNLMSPSNPAIANKMFHHLILTQKLLSQRRGSDQEFESTMQNLRRHYLDTLPVDDLSSIVYWDQATLNQVDSDIIRQTYKNTTEYYKAIYRAIITHPESPYSQATDETPISEEEFVWAFSTVSAR